MATVRYNFTWLKIFSLTHSPHNASHVDVVHLYWVNPINSLSNDLQAKQNILPYSLDKVLAFRKNHLQQPVYQCWCNQIGRSATVFGQMSEIQLGIGNSAKKYFLCVLCEIEKAPVHWHKVGLAIGPVWTCKVGSNIYKHDRPNTCIWCGPAKQDQIFINMMIDDNIWLKHYLELNEELSGPVPAGMTSQTWQE